LNEIAKNEKNRGIREEALTALIKIARNYSHLYQDTSLSYALPGDDTERVINCSAFKESRNDGGIRSF
jgi:hypothetical protein